MNQDFDTELEEDVTLTGIQVSGGPSMTVGVGDRSGDIYVRGDLHPLGSASALLTAAAQHIPYVALSAVEVLYPLDWLKGECAHDIDRLRVLANLESFVRSGFSQGAGVRQ
ncbi:MAG: hypothetical protein LCH79_15290 [Proteobacteria bacterium]|nr:hypothetical protein [Pseudomonadota bacterium]